MPFNVKPFKNNSFNLKTNYNKSIPQPQNGGFRLMITGASGSGKTILGMNLLVEMRKFFKKIMIFTPNTSQYEKNFSKYMTRHDHLISDFKEEILEKHYKKMVKRNRKRKKSDTPMLVYLDDMLTLVQNSQIFKDLMLCSRKENLSLVFTTHKYTFSNPLIRQNLTHFILMTSNKIELRLIAQYLGIDKEDMYKYWNDNIKKKFDFLYIIVNPLQIFYKFSDKRLN